MRDSIISRKAFTVVELLVTVTIIGLLGALTLPIVHHALVSGRISQSMNNLRQLVNANLSYSVDHDGTLCPAQNSSNTVRWHGARSSPSERFDPTEGFLSPYLGKDHRVNVCPLFEDAIDDLSSFELGTGGYGYNAAYLGGTPATLFRSERLVNVERLSSTVMFTTTALAKAGGLQEYPYTEPYRWVLQDGSLAGPLQPSTHFRAKGKAIIAWCDGRISLEEPDRFDGPNFYGGSNEEDQIGWFGPDEENGYWNPRRSYSQQP